MATGVASWSKTAATNSTADSAVNWAEGQAPSSVNDSARGMMASVAKWRDDISGTITTAGTSTAYTIATTNQGFASAAAMSGALICFIPHTTSGASPTLAVDGLTARAINSATGVAVATGALVVGTPHVVTYIHATTEFILQGYINTFGNLVATGTLNVTGASTLAAVSGTTGTFSGAVSGTTGTFSGAVSGTTGGFSAGVSGTTGTFSGAVSGTTGTFSSTLTASNGFTVSAGAVSFPAASIAAAAVVGGLPSAATQAEEEAASSTTVYTSPGRQKFHPGVAKAWAKWNNAATVAASYNVSSVTDNSVGDWTVNFTVSFSSADYSVSALISPDVAAGKVGLVAPGVIAASSCEFFSIWSNNSGFPDSLAASPGIFALFHGDQ